MLDTIGIDDFHDPATMIALDSPQVAEALERLARDVPYEGVDIGKPLAAMWVPAEHCVRLLTSVGLFDSYSAHAERLVSVGAGEDETAEWTSWCGGRETDRRARRTSDLRP